MLTCVPAPHTGLPNDESTILTYIVGGLLSYAWAKESLRITQFPTFWAPCVCYGTYIWDTAFRGRIKVPICTKKTRKQTTMSHRLIIKKWDRFFKLSEGRGEWGGCFLFAGGSRHINPHLLAGCWHRLTSHTFWRNLTISHQYQIL